MAIGSKFRGDSNTSNDDLYEKAWAELEAKDIQQGLWARIWSENDGDETKTKAAYLKERVKQLGESSNSVESPRRDQATQQTDQTSKRVIKWFVWIALAIVILFVLLQTGLGPDGIQASQLGVMKGLLMLAVIAPFLLFGKLVHRFLPKFTYAASCGLGFIMVVGLVAIGSVLFR